MYDPGRSFYNFKIVILGCYRSFVRRHPNFYSLSWIICISSFIPWFVRCLQREQMYERNICSRSIYSSSLPDLCWYRRIRQGSFSRFNPMSRDPRIKFHSALSWDPYLCQIPMSESFWQKPIFSPINYFKTLKRKMRSMVLSKRNFTIQWKILVSIMSMLQRRERNQITIQLQQHGMLFKKNSNVLELTDIKIGLILQSWVPILDFHSTSM